MSNYNKTQYLMAPTIHALGLETNARLSRGHNIRIGKKGSLSIDTEQNVFFDHETGESGGVLELIKRHWGFSASSQANEWYSENVNHCISWSPQQPPKTQRPEEPSNRALERFHYIISNTSPASPTHPYIQSKCIPASGLRQYKGALCIPLKTAEGLLSGIQLIEGNGDKKFVKGTKTHSAYFSFGRTSSAKTITICEGLATGATLQQHSNATVVCALSANNLMPVALSLKHQYPKAAFVVAGDNDHHKPVNTGFNKAKEAALAIAAKLIIPPQCDDGCVCCDFNDLMSKCKHKGGIELYG